MDSSDEARKKRPQVEQKQAQEEKLKKVRVEASSSSSSRTTTTSNLSPARRRSGRDSGSNNSSSRSSSNNNNNIEWSSKPRAVDYNNNSNNNITNNGGGTNSECGRAGNKFASSPRRIWDLESALLYLVRVDGSQEYLTNDHSMWVTFRVGHAGDASTVANWYRQSCKRQRHDEDDTDPELLETKRPANNNVLDNNDEVDSSTSSSSMLEVWLADGLGDEDTPPSVYCLLANVHKKTNSVSSSDESSSSSSKLPSASNRLGAVAILTLAWVEGERMLRIEWMHVDPKLSSLVASTLARKVWLRLSTLSLMTACQVLAVDEKYTRQMVQDDDDEDDDDNNASKRLTPSAE